MKKTLLLLLATPTVIGTLFSLVVSVKPAVAQAINSTNDAAQNNCQISPHANQLICVRATKPLITAQNTASITNTNDDNEPPMVEFSEEDSNMAVKLFGCDCPACINASRQLRGLPPVNS